MKVSDIKTQANADKFMKQVSRRIFFDDIKRRVFRFVADTIGQLLFLIIYHLPHFKGGTKIMVWVIRYETAPDETK